MQALSITNLKSSKNKLFPLACGPIKIVKSPNLTSTDLIGPKLSTFIFVIIFFAIVPFAKVHIKFGNHKQSTRNNRFQLRRHQQLITLPSVTHVMDNTLHGAGIVPVPCLHSPCLQLCEVSASSSPRHCPTISGKSKRCDSRSAQSPIFRRKDSLDINSVRALASFSSSPT